ncbi:MAG: cation:proton antiporter, partial [Myxococcales bacterium]|nr:cation:proton antiporter [Myxococcales bacterium]
MEPSYSLIADLVAVLITAGFAAWLCQKLKISSILGYLATGIIVGPFTQPTLVHNIENVHTLANLGLIFVMFFIGLELSLKRLQRLGVAPILVTLLTALFIFNGTRLFGGFLGFDSVQLLIIAATIMVSSSVIVSRVLHELDITHEPFARSAMGVTLLEDTVAVSMIAILGSLGVTSSGSSVASPEEANLTPLLGHLAGFVLLAMLLALLLVPKILNGVRRFPNEVMSILTAGLLIGLAYLAAAAGYSLALGAFLFGSVVGGTAYKAHFLQSFE